MSVVCSCFVLAGFGFGGFLLFFVVLGVSVAVEGFVARG
jgi:hypothetical protein